MNDGEYLRTANEAKEGVLHKAASVCPCVLVYKQGATVITVVFMGEGEVVLPQWLRGRE